LESGGCEGKSGRIYPLRPSAIDDHDGLGAKQGQREPGDGGIQAGWCEQYQIICQVDSGSSENLVDFRRPVVRALPIRKG
jgi:hypothetical protein